jgi:type 1 glutamine amidotransferase
MLGRMRVVCAVAMIAILASGSKAADQWLTFEGKDGPGQGKHVVLIAGDEEYRSEEALPQLAKILSKHHGFTCTVLFPINPADGTIDPEYVKNIPGLEALKNADLMIIQTRFRDLPDEQMKYIADYVDSGKPIIGMRTATHAFKIEPGKTYSKYSWDSKEPGWEGGFGRRILGETWINHHGHHGQQSTRAVLASGAQGSPIVKGCDDVWGPTDVYAVRLPLPGDCKTILLGEVLEGMNPTDKPVDGKQNNPMMPVAWTKSYAAAGGQPGRSFTTTMGAATDLQSEGLRRLLVNAAYWAIGMEDKISPAANVALVGEYHPTPFGFGKHVKGKKPADYAAE